VVLLVQFRHVLPPEEVRGMGWRPRKVSRRELGGIFIPRSVSFHRLVSRRRRRAYHGERRDVRQALEPCFEFVSEELHVLYDILVRPFTRREVLHERKELSDQHRWQIGGRRLRDEVLNHPRRDEYEVVTRQRRVMRNCSRGASLC